ncbi:hypothetical protein B0J14DRAFT_654697 [Halenospora varia]|nr:hypothetical protein B0J14DRAFT_654697 [Halenospora varia]
MLSATFESTTLPISEPSLTTPTLTLRGGGSDSDNGYEADTDPDNSADTESDEDFYGHDDSQEKYEPYKTEDRMAWVYDSRRELRTSGGLEWERNGGWVNGGRGWEMRDGMGLYTEMA